jgi:hypothetical protein
LRGTSGFSRTAATGARFRIASKIVAALSPTEGQLPGRHLIENGSKREQVGPRTRDVCPNQLEVSRLVLTDTAYGR